MKKISRIIGIVILGILVLANFGSLMCYLLSQGEHTFLSIYTSFVGFASGLLAGIILGLPISIILYLLVAWGASMR